MPCEEGHVDPYNKLSSDEDYESVLRWALQSKSAQPFGAEQLCWLLRQGHMRLQATKRKAVAIWRGPLSLFDEQSEVQLGLKGAPPWATHTVRLAQQLLEEAAMFHDRADMYEAQIKLAHRTGRGIQREAILRLLDWADNLQERFLKHLPELAKAREALDELNSEDGFLGRSRTGQPVVSVKAVPLWRDLVNGSYVGAGKGWREQVGLSLMPIHAAIPAEIVEPVHGCLHPLWTLLGSVQRRFDVVGMHVTSLGVEIGEALCRASGMSDAVVLGKKRSKRKRSKRAVSLWQAPPEILRHATYRAWLRTAQYWQALEQVWHLGCFCLGPLHITPPQLTVGYWNIRGLGAPLRMMCEYSGVEYVDQRYEARQKNNGRWSAPDWERGDKLDLLERNEFSQLPYVYNDNNGDVVAQSSAVSLYLGRLLGLNGINSKAQTANEQVLFQVHAIWMEVYALVYPFKHNKDAEAFKRSLDIHLRTTVPEFYKQLQVWLDLQGTEYVAGWRPCVADFHVWEVMDQHEGMANKHGFVSPLDDFELLKVYYRNFRRLPSLRAYFESPTAKLPANHKMAFYQ
mmetsp:Transcript_15779/g.37099  ORF Transcript_15779/g.37099 Transcript_15779/m.37099 type:complete len:570 (-) Transcript_15779:112-1821(-)